MTWRHASGPTPVPAHSRPVGHEAGARPARRPPVQRCLLNEVRTRPRAGKHELGLARLDRPQRRQSPANPPPDRRHRPPHRARPPRRSSLAEHAPRLAYHSRSDTAPGAPLHALRRHRRPAHHPRRPRRRRRPTRHSARPPPRRAPGGPPGSHGRRPRPSNPGDSSMPVHATPCSNSSYRSTARTAAIKCWAALPRSATDYCGTPPRWSRGRAPAPCHGR